MLWQFPLWSTQSEPALQQAPVSPPQTPLAELGILMTFALIPILGTAIFTILFALTYDIKDEKKAWLEEQLRAKDLHK